ncbi:hypothetical protein Tco_0936588 [Tanacetum coccineum]|uniref:Uncharacterized protein n=1 Tax=Tanacetum coccineum TaxID=301880 RepID=A0ABQ5DDQ9_9ASTR
MALTAYADADHAGCQDTRRSTSGSAQFLGDNIICHTRNRRALRSQLQRLNTLPLPLLSAAIMSSTPDPSTLTYDTFLRRAVEERHNELSTCADTMADINIPANDAPTEQAPTVASPTKTDDQILPLSKNTTSLGPSWHPLQFWLSTFSSFGTLCALTHLLGCTVVSWMSNGSIFTKIFSEMLSISLPPMITIPLWLHRRVIQLSSMSTLWDTPVHSGTCQQCQDIQCFKYFGVDSETESEEEVPVIKAGDQDEGQAGPNPDLETTDASTQQKSEQIDEEFTTTAYLNVKENLKLPTEDEFFKEKPQEEEPGKTNAKVEVQSMVSVPIHQDTSSVPPITTLVIDLKKSQFDSPLSTSTTTTSTITTTITLSPPPLQSTTDLILVHRIGELEQHIVDLIQNNMALEERLDKHGSRLYKLENLNIPYHVSKAVDEIVTDAVDWAMQAPLQARFKDLPTIDMQEILQQWIKRYESPRTPLVSPLTQPSPPPPPVGASGAPADILGAQELSSTDYPMKDASIPEEQTIPSSNKSDVVNNWASTLATTYEPPAENSLLVKIRDMTTFMNWYCQKVNKTVLTQADFEGQAYEVVKAFYPDVIHLLFQMEECHKMLTDQVDWTNPEGTQVSVDVNRPLPLGGPLGHVTIQTQFFFNKDLEYLRYGSNGSIPALSISKMKAARYPDFGLELLVLEHIWIDDVCTYDISATYGIFHWWFNRQKFYIDRHDSPSRRKEVRTHMRILSVIRVKAYSRYGYDYLSKIILRRADFQEHIISKKDFKNLYPSDFEDLNLLLFDSTAGYEFKHDYTIIESPPTVVFPVDNNDRKIMRFNKIYKFSDATLTHILEALDYKVKKFKVKQLNPGMNTRFWTEKDMTWSKEFIAAIERRLKTIRIYRNLEFFVGGRVHDIDYKLLQRTE